MRFLFVFLVAITAAAQQQPLAIEIDLTAQKAWIVRAGQRMHEAPISSGRGGHETPTGEFAVLEKDTEHKSSHYGRIVDRAGRTLVPDVDSDTPVPAGARFVQTAMRHFLRFDGAIGMHAGRLPGYPASHGCVRLPAGKAALYFDLAEIGTPIRIFGRTPRTGPAPTTSPRPKGWQPQTRSL